jgi:hypothetical protein
MVFTLVSDPVGMGYVESLAHPGGKITGFMTYDPPIYTKQLQMLTEITPPAKTVAVLYNPQTAPYAGRILRAMEGAARSLGVSLRDAPCHDEAGIEVTMTALAQAGNGGLLAIAEVFNVIHRQAIATLALTYKIAYPRVYASNDRERRPDGICDRLPGSVSSFGGLYRSNLQRGNDSQSTGPGSHKIPLDDQSSDRQGARPRGVADVTRYSRRGGRVAADVAIGTKCVPA